MSKLPQILIVILISNTFFNCEQKTELTDLEFEQKVFYQLFPELSDKIYNDTQIASTPTPPSPKYLTEKGFDAKTDYNKALANWEKSSDYQNRINAWQKRRDSIINDSIEIYIAFPDSINRFGKEDMYALINHFNQQKLSIDSKHFELVGGFKVDFNRLKFNNQKLRFKPISEIPNKGKIWNTNYDFNYGGSLSFTRILFDKTKSYGVLNAGFVKGPLNGIGCRIFIKKLENGNWMIHKIKGTWIS